MQNNTAPLPHKILQPPSLLLQPSLIPNLADDDEKATSLGKTVLPSSQGRPLPLPRRVESVSTSLSSSSSSSATLNKPPELSTPTKNLPKKKSFNEVLESMIAANTAFGLEDKNTPENLNIFGKLFNVTTDVTKDQIQEIIAKHEKKLEAFRSKRKTTVNSRSDSRSDSREEQTSSDRNILGFSFGSKIKGDVNAATPPRVEAGQSQMVTEPPPVSAAAAAAATPPRVERSSPPSPRTSFTHVEPAQASSIFSAEDDEPQASPPKPEKLIEPNSLDNGDDIKKYKRMFTRYTYDGFMNELRKLNYYDNKNLTYAYQETRKKISTFVDSDDFTKMATTATQVLKIIDKETNQQELESKINLINNLYTTLQPYMKEADAIIQALRRASGSQYSEVEEVDGGGKRKRTIKRKHRSIRYNTLRSKK